MSGIFPIPRGGGAGGSSLIYGVAQLLGYTDPGSDAVGPPALTVNVSNNGYITVGFDGTDYTFCLDASNPYDGSIFIDTSGLFTLDDRANALIGGLNGLTSLSSSSYNAINNGGGDVVISPNTATGAGTSLSASAANNVTSGGGTGADAVPASGEISLIDIIAATGGKSIRIVNIGYISVDGMAVPFQIGFKNGLTFNSVASFNSLAPGAYGIIGPIPELIDNWFGSFPSYSLHMMFNDEIPVGGDVKVWAVVEKV